MKEITENRKQERKTAGHRSHVLPAAVFAFLLLTVSAAGIFAKYSTENGRKAEMASAHFHLTSDYLEEGNASGTPEKAYPVTSWANGFSVILYNYEKENTAQISADAISYQVKILVNGSADENAWYCGGEGIDDWKITGNGTYSAVFPENTECTSQTLKIRPGSDAVTGDRVDIYVTTTAPFVKTLCARFTVTVKESPDYTFTDCGDGTALLTIHTNNYSGNITVSWDSAVYAPDSADSLMKNWVNTDGVSTYALYAGSDHYTYELLFFKKTGNAVTEITDGSGTSIELK